MAKKTPKKKSTKKPDPGSKSPTKSFLETLEKPRIQFIFFIILFFFISIFYIPLAFDGKEVTGSDVVSGIGKTHQIKEFEKETEKRPLWNPYMFGGMPIYQRYGPVIWSFDTLMNELDIIMDWRVWYLWAGALGMFLLIKYIGLSSISAIMAALAFILMPHFQALIIVGHFAKFRALMWLPYILLTFLMLIEKRDLLSMFLFTLAFAFEMRTQHYQIIFYGLLLLLFVGIVPYFRLVIEKKWDDFFKLTGLVIAAIILVILIVAQPLFVIRDYTPYSTRAGNSISITEKVSEQDKKGVGFDYATRWSYSVDEFWNLIIPKFHGGTSNEIYKGDSVPQLKNQPIPAYWGVMPFTQSYEYLGIFLVFLVLVAIIFCWERSIIKYLAFLTVFALILSLGSNFSALYKAFFYYFPYFDKFRAPVMILTLVMFNVSVLAAFGLDSLIKADLGNKKIRHKFYILSGIFLLLILIPIVLGSNFALSQAQEIEKYVDQYGQEGAKQIIEMLKQARLDILKSSALRTLLFFSIPLLFILAIKNNWLKKDYSVIAIVIFIILDLGLISSGYLKGKFSDLQRVEKQYYGENALDAIIKNDNSLFRVSPPINNLANDSRWSYHYQSIGGYSPAKLQLIQDLIENNFVRNIEGSFPLNLNVFSMLNVKYLVERQRLSHPDLEFLGSDNRKNLYLYMNRRKLPRSFFVKNTRIIVDGIERLTYMNTMDFNPAEEALLEEKLSEPINSPDSSWSEITHFEPDKVVLKVYTDCTSLLVLSEVFYPEGWRAYMDSGKELKIYKTNHIIRSMILPSGEHTITMEFKPDAFFNGIKISLLGIVLTYLGIIFLIYRKHGQQFIRWAKHRKTVS
jgi:hypothetical protein